jgi:hypothetical protein
MNQQAAAIIIAGALIAAAIVFTNHWEVVTGGMRMNRWTGTIIVCNWVRNGDELKCPPTQ